MQEAFKELACWTVGFMFIIMLMIMNNGLEVKGSGGSQVDGCKEHFVFLFQCNYYL